MAEDRRAPESPTALGLRFGLPIAGLGDPGEAGEAGCGLPGLPDPEREEDTDSRPEDARNGTGPSQ